MLLVFIPTAGTGSALDWQPNVINIQNTPPGAPVAGDRYIVDTVPTGAWVGQSDDIATWTGSAWDFTTPEDGWAAYVETPQAIYIFDGGWAVLPTTPLATTPPVDSTFAAAAIGVGTTAARDDHKHDLGTPLAPADVTKAVATTGVGTIPARSDHKHDVVTAAPATVLSIGATAAEGAGVNLARSTHIHQFPVPTIVSDVMSAGGSLGVSTIVARQDHRHAHGNLLGGTLHSLVANGTPGFIAGLPNDAGQFYDGVGVWRDLNLFSALTFGGGDITAAGTGARYMSPWYEPSNPGTTEVFIEDWPFACTISQLRGAWGPSGNSVNVDFVLRINAADSALTFTALSDAGSGSDLANSVSVSAGDRVSFVVRKSAATGTAMQEAQMSMRVEAA